MKRYILIVILCFFIVPVYALIGPIRDIPRGERLWDITSRIGEMLDTETSCDFGITQEDIGDGGVFTITDPGAYYCLTETVTISAGTGITIAASNVVLDLNGHAIVGSGATNIQAISLEGALNNITIKNGTIRDLSGTEGDGIRKLDDNLQLNNVILQDLHLIDLEGNGVHLAFNTVLNDTNNVLIQNCRLYNAGDLALHTDNAIIRNCQVINTARLGRIIPLSVTMDPRSESILVEDCIVTGTAYTAPVRQGFEFFDAKNVTIRRSIVESSEQYGVSFDRCNHVIVDDCIVTDVGLDGIRLFDLDDVIIQDCSIEASQSLGINAVRCRALTVRDTIINSTADTGFLLRSDATACEHLLLERCVVTNAANDGFRVVKTVGLEAVDNVLFVDCVASNCEKSGFALWSFGFSDTSKQMTNVGFRNCSSFGNGINGFFTYAQYYGPTTDFIATEIKNLTFENCLARENGGDGFNISSICNMPIVDIVFDKCIATGNLGGASDTTLSLTFSGHGFGVERAGKCLFKACIAQDNSADGFHTEFMACGSHYIDCCATTNGQAGFQDLGTADSSVLMGNMAINNTTGSFINLIEDPSLLMSYFSVGEVAGATRFTNIEVDMVCTVSVGVTKGMGIEVPEGEIGGGGPPF